MGDSQNGVHALQRISSILRLAQASGRQRSKGSRRLQASSDQPQRQNAEAVDQEEGQREEEGTLALQGQMGTCARCDCWRVFL